MTKAGMPKSGRNSYPLIACIQWYIGYFKDKARDVSNQMAREKRRLLKVKADRGEYEFGELKKELVRRADVEQACFDAGRIARDAIMNVPERVAAIIAAKTDPEDINELLSKELRQALEGLNDIKLQ